MILEGSGTQTASIGSEHILSGATFTGMKVYVLEVDVAAMVAGDITELRCYGTTLSAGTERLYWAEYLYGVQLDPKKVSIPIASDISLKFTLKQTFGTGRNYPWKVLSV